MKVKSKNVGTRFDGTFQDVGTNTLTAVFVWIILSTLLCFLLWIPWVGDMGFKTSVLISVVLSAIVAFGDTDSVDILTDKMLLFRGKETGKRVPPGSPYFLFFLWSLDESEKQSKAIEDINIPFFSCQDNKRKVLKGEGDGKIRVKPGLEDQYKLQDAKSMPDSLAKLVVRTAKRITPTLPYKSKNAGDAQIMGEDLGDRVLQDKTFQRECEKWGIEFTSLIIDVIADDLKQENLLSYANELREEAKAEYSENHQFTHQELEDIEARVQTMIGRARRIITNSAILGRYNIDAEADH